MANMNLIDRYVLEVGRQLPEKNRADVQLELRSALQDALEERGLDANKAGDQQAIAMLLKEFGRPSKVAASYGASNYLVGPELFSLYKVILRVSFIVITAAALIGLLLGVSGRPELSEVFGDVAGSYFESLLINFAIVTGIFALLEREEVKTYMKKPDWDPFKLPDVTDRDRAQIFDLIVELFFSALAIGVVLIIPDLVGPGGALNEDWNVIAVLATEFAPFIPWLVAAWIGDFALKLFVLVRGRWNKPTRVLEFALAAANVIIFASMFSAAPFGPVALVDTIVKLSLGIAVVIGGIDAAVQLYHLVFPDSRLPGQAALAKSAK